MSEASLTRRIEEIEVLVGEIKGQLDQVLLNRTIEQTLEGFQDDPLSAAKLQVTLAYTMNTLYLCMLQDQCT